MAQFNFITDVNVPAAYRAVLFLLGWSGQTQKVETRNGQAMVLDGPLAMSILAPQERVLACPERNANPVFHLMEALWMLAGRNEVAFVQQFNKQMYTYSDNGIIFNAAYGHRWRNHFGYDQLARAVELLKANPGDRRVVISMWDPHEDMDGISKDYPCNLQALPRIVRGKLNMLTTNRSNDVIWGMLGANCVHLTIMQEWLAAAIGCKMGVWQHVTNNAHIYEQHWPLLPNPALGYREARSVQPVGKYPGFMPLVKNPWAFLIDCEELCAGKVDDFAEPFFDDVVAPMIQSWQKYKEGDLPGAQYDASCIAAPDWRIATTEWYGRKANVSK